MDNQAHSTAFKTQITVPEPEIARYQTFAEPLTYNNQLILMKFKYFSRLPLEIRVQIWRFACETRTIELVKTYAGRDKRTVQWQIRQLQSQTPALLLVSKEARYEALRLYQRLNGGMTGTENYVPGEPVYGPFIDTIYIMSYEATPIHPRLLMNRENFVERWSNVPAERMAEHREGLEELSRSAWASRITSLAIHVEELCHFSAYRRKPEEVSEILQRFSILEELIIVYMEEQYCISSTLLSTMMHSSETEKTLADNQRIQWEKLSFIHLDDADPKCALEMANSYAEGRIGKAQLVLDGAVEAGWKAPVLKARVARGENGGQNRLLFMSQPLD